MKFLRFPSRLPRPAVALVLASALTARAGFVITGEHKSLDKTQPAFTYTLSVDKDKVRIESTNTPENFIIYRADKGVFWMIDGKEKSYTEMTRENIESMTQKMNEAMKKMDEQLAQLPPEQRESIKKSMKAMMPGGGKMTFKKTGMGKAGAWSCQNYESYSDGAKRADMCLADPKAVGIPDADFKSFKDMTKPFEKLARDMAGFLPPSEVEGIPVKSVFYKDGKATGESNIKSVKSESLSANLFELPAGLTKREHGHMPGE
jgi:hypothetical protein